MRNFAPCENVPLFIPLLTFDFFCHFLFVSPICPHCNSACFDLLVILYWVLSIKDPRRDTVKDSSPLIKFLGGKLSALLALSHYLSFSLTFSPFLTSQTPSEDDNSKDERLEPLSP